MMIRDKRRKPTCHFEDINAGTVFELDNKYDNGFYEKLYREYSDEHHKYNVCRLSDGSLEYCQPTELINYVDDCLIIKDRDQEWEWEERWG